MNIISCLMRNLENEMMIKLLLENYAKMNFDGMKLKINL